MPTSNRRPSPLAARIATAPRRHDNNYPLWAGPSGEGPLGGITQSMLVCFLSCRERFRLKYVLGLEPHDKWNHHMGYGNMWHACEEALAEGKEEWSKHLIPHTAKQAEKYPFQREEIAKWYNVCRVQFPEYVKHWTEHPDVQNRTPLMQEQVFDVPYTLPSGRVVRLRGKWDSVDLISDGQCNCDYEEGNDWQHYRTSHSPDCPVATAGIYLQENKTKGDIDKMQVERQLKFDLQTMMYLVVLKEEWGNSNSAHFNTLMGTGGLIAGVRYNVVRRPLSGGVGSIKPHQAKSTKATYSKKDGRVLKDATFTPAETDEEFYERLRRDYIAADPGHWFFRVRAEVSNKDIQVFRDTCLDPLLETVCFWYEWVTRKCVSSKGLATCFNYRTPFGVWSALEEGGATEYDAYLETGSEAGLRRMETLFPELQ